MLDTRGYLCLPDTIDPRGPKVSDLVREPALIDDLMSFGREHAGCGQIEGDVRGGVEVVCACGARMKRDAAETREPTFQADGLA